MLGVSCIGRVSGPAPFLSFIMPAPLSTGGQCASNEFSFKRRPRGLFSRILPLPDVTVTIPCAALSAHPSRSDTSQTPDWSRLASAGRRAVRAARNANRPLRDVVMDNPTNPFLWHAAIMHEVREKRQVAEAHRLLDIALVAVPQGRRAALFLTRGSLQRGQDAINTFHEGIADDSTHGPTYVYLAFELARSGNVDEARKIFAKGAENVPMPYRVRVLRSWASFEFGQKNKIASRDLWRQVTILDPRDLVSWRRLLDAEKVLNAKPQDVMAIFREALAVHPTYSELHIGLSLLIEKQDGPGAARDYLDAPQFREDSLIQRSLALLEVREGNLERARLVFRRAADLEAQVRSSTSATATHEKLDQTIVNDNSSKGNVYNDQYLSQSRRSRSKALPKAEVSSSVKSLHAWALMEVRTGNISRARDLLQEARIASPDDPAIWRAVAELESRSRNFEIARKAFQRSLTYDSEDVRLWLAWGKTEALAGNLERAEELVQTAIYKYKQELKLRDKRLGASSAVQDRLFEDGSLDVEADRLNLLLSPPSSSPSSLPAHRRAPIPVRLLADAQRELSSIAIQNGNVEKAVEFLTQAVTTDPDFDQGWRQLSEQLIKLRGIDHVRDMFRWALRVSSTRLHAKLYHWWALEERSVGNISDARQLYRRSIRADRTYMSAWLSWALSEKSEDNIDSALEILKEAAAIATKHSMRTPFIFQAWARLEELHRNNADESRRIFEEGFRLCPESGSLLQAWACLEDRAGRSDMARALLRKATIAEPNHGFIWQYWGLLEARRRRYDEAARLFALGMEKDPRNAAIPASWAMMEGRDLGHLKRGRELFELSTRIDPLYASSWHSWGSLEMAHRNFDKARNLYLKAASLEPNDPIAWHALGTLEIEQGMSLTVPVKYFQRALSVDPQHALSYQAWALFLERSGQNVDEAVELYSKGIKACGKSGKAVLYQGWASLEQRRGNLEAARQLLRTGLSIDRHRAELWLMLALLEKSCGNRTTAHQIFRDGASAISPARDLAPLYTAWGAAETEMGNFDFARELFDRGLRINPSHEACWRSYANLEETVGNAVKAERLRSSATGRIDPNVIATEQGISVAS